MLGLVGAASAPLVLEGALRVRAYLKYGTFGTLHAFEAEEETGLRIPTRHASRGGQTTDSRGFRSPELEVPKPEGRLRLAFLGGSTTYCAEVTNNAHTWPALTVEGLRARLPAVELDFANAAVSGFATDASLRNLNERVARVEQDVVVIYQATNDLTKESLRLAREHGVVDVAPHEDSWLARYSLTALLIERNFKLQRNVLAAGDRPLLEVDPAELSRAFRERLTSLVRAAQTEARLVVLITFANQPRATQSPAELREACRIALYYMPYHSPGALVSAYGEYNCAIREVAAETSALPVEGEDLMPGDGEHFVDSVHLSDASCARLAERVIDELAPAVEALLAEER